MRDTSQFNGKPLSKWLQETANGIAAALEEHSTEHLSGDDPEALVRASAYIVELEARAVPDGRELVECPECGGVGAVPPRIGKSRPTLCSHCDGMGYTLYDQDGSDGLKRFAALNAEASHA